MFAKNDTVLVEGVDSATCAPMSPSVAEVAFLAIKGPPRPPSQTPERDFAAGLFLFMRIPEIGGTLFRLRGDLFSLVGFCELRHHVPGEQLH